MLHVITNSEMAGFDSARARFEAQAAALGIAARTLFVEGTLAPEQLHAAADLYVLPTRYDPFANSTLEALACGLPVITSCANGGAELITSGVEGASLEPFEALALRRDTARAR